jgi:signal transduction histidine kinase
MNAESAHRGFLLTGDPRYLEPVMSAGETIDTLSRQLLATYQGRDARVRAAMEQIGVIAHQRVGQMRESLARYQQDGPAAGLAMANSASRQKTMATFREMEAIVQAYEEALLQGSVAEWNRALQVAGRLNFATLLVGLFLAALAATLFLRDARQRMNVAAELARQHDELKAQADAQAAELSEVYRHLQNVQEEERARLSRGLHDELGGVLLAARMDVTWMQRHTPGGDEEIKLRLERVRQALDQGIDLKRRVVEELRPTLLDTMGLLAALRWQIEETCRRANLSWTERLPDEEPQFSRAGAITLFRVVQEALANVVKHAGASEVEISLDVLDEQVVLTIRDDGAGASPADLARPQRHGIAGMLHRVRSLGGQLEISSGPARGTLVHVRVPRSSVIQKADDAGSTGTLVAMSGAERGAPA